MADDDDEGDFDEGDFDDNGAPFDGIMMEGEDEEEADGDGDNSAKKCRRKRMRERQDTVDRRRERNRMLARKTRLRKKFFFESLQQQVSQLTSENEMLKEIVKQRLDSKLRSQILSSCPSEKVAASDRNGAATSASAAAGLRESNQGPAGGSVADSRATSTGEKVGIQSHVTSLAVSSAAMASTTASATAVAAAAAAAAAADADTAVATSAPTAAATAAAAAAGGSSSNATVLLSKTDYNLMSSIQAAQRSFVITDPSLPDNPIIFASKGFLDLSGYTLDEVLGRNCRFMQSPNADPNQVKLLREGISRGVDVSVCLLNVRADGTEFYNQIFVAALRDADGNIANYVGVQLEVRPYFFPCCLHPLCFAALSFPLTSRHFLSRTPFPPPLPSPYRSNALCQEPHLSRTCGRWNLALCHLWVAPGRVSKPW